ncbi:hypothetical protein N331_00731, partial [Merops nubicus]
MLSEDPLESVSLQSNRPFMGQYKKPNENQTHLPGLTGDSPDAMMRNTVPSPTAVHMAPAEKEVSEEMEL